MNKRLEISIPKSCSENWAGMTQVAGGKYCTSCQKKVTDFTDFNEKAIQEWFLLHQNEKVCGRFLKSQLVVQAEPKVSVWDMVRTKILAASVLLFPFVLKASPNLPVQKQTITVTPVQEHTATRTAEKQPQPADSLRTIKGIVLDKNTRESLRGAEVTIKGTRIRSFADSTGNFQISFSKDVKPVLVIVYLGYKTFEQEAGTDKFVALMRTEDTSKLMGEVCIVRRPSLFKKIIRPIKKSL
ncbi:hypothetical protein CPT03_07215 [Pedobacter ginsengisoli]|uniref:TonB-dependent receptor n=1 Tax=Pedobacter ginsengisoli TaxID=363852 RepID=A0A2D1U3V7_9SPHI|nr:carboxypeptidase-like regulatory domain-containing protein [Pedobacter ginsengisoli]ATP56275.1 hypothetical protein CPT03_07215 [Pedobacter ginsengisoli]